MLNDKTMNRRRFLIGAAKATALGAVAVTPAVAVAGTLEKPTLEQMERYLCFLWNESRAVAHALGHMNERGQVGYVPMMDDAPIISWNTPPSSRALPVLRAAGLIEAV